MTSSTVDFAEVYGLLRWASIYAKLRPLLASFATFSFLATAALYLASVVNFLGCWLETREIRLRRGLFYHWFWESKIVILTWSVAFSSCLPEVQGLLLIEDLLIP